ncbi:MAG: glycosyl transferase family 1, partial [Bacteroidales bacterium]|nr:glycosyl transferase family 1 [Bacteroidales bacterium]
MSKIKIIGPGYPFRGGLAAFNERMALEFRESGYNIEIETFTLQYPAILFPGKTQYSDRDKPVNLEIRRSINSVSPLNWLSVGNRIRKEKPDLVIFRYWLPFMAPCFGTIARRLKKDANIKVLALVDNIIPHEKRVGDTMFTRYFIKPVDGFIIMSESVNTELDRFDSGKPRIYTPHPVFDNF